MPAQKPVQRSLFGDIDADFDTFHKENPEVYRQLVRFSRIALQSGFSKYGIGAVAERVRWHIRVDTRGEDYKLNNNFRSRYARLIMSREKDLAGFFDTRELRS